MLPRALVLAAFTFFAGQSSQAPPPATPPTSPFAAAAIRHEGAGTPVGLTFAWPANTTATVEAEHSKLVITPEGRKATTGGLRYRMRVLAHKDGRLIEYDNFEPVGATLAASEQSALAETLSAFMPSLVVANTGDFLRVGDLTTIRAAIRELIDTARRKAPAGAVPPNLQAILDGLSSEEVLSQVAAAEWQTFVGAYVGFSGTIGEMTEFDSEEPSPMVPGLTVPMRTTFGARERVACEAGRAADSCVVMLVRSVVAPGAMQAILKRLLEGMKGLEGVTYDSFDVTTEVLTTLEPSTMRPYQVTRTKTADITVTIPGQGRANASTTDRRSYKINWPR